MIKHIIFDLDGVLFDGCDVHAMLFMEAVSAIRPDIHITKEYHATTLHALSTHKKLEILHIVGEDANRIYALKQQMTARYIRENIQPDTKNIQICEKLVSMQYKLYCVSNSIRSTMESILTGMNIMQFFTGIISNQDTTEPKPSPQPYLTLYKRYNIDTNECMILEDSEYGIESATKSGGNVLCVRNCMDVTFDTIMKATTAFDNGLCADKQYVVSS